MRKEKGLSPEIALRAINRAVELAELIGAGKAVEENLEGDHSGACDRRDTPAPSSGPQLLAPPARVVRVVAAECG